MLASHVLLTALAGLNSLTAQPTIAQVRLESPVQRDDRIRVGQSIDLRLPPPLEREPLTLTWKRFPHAHLHHIINSIPASARDRVKRFTPIHLDWNVKKSLELEIYAQILRHPETPTLIRVAPARTGFGEQGWTVMYPLKMSDYVRYLWPNGGEKESLAAFVEVYPLAEHPYMYLVGLAKVEHPRMKRWWWSISQHPLAESVRELVH